MMEQSDEFISHTWNDCRDRYESPCNPEQGSSASSSFVPEPCGSSSATTRYCTASTEHHQPPDGTTKASHIQILRNTKSHETEQEHQQQTLRSRRRSKYCGSKRSEQRKKYKEILAHGPFPSSESDIPWPVSWLEQEKVFAYRTRALHRVLVEENILDATKRRTTTADPSWIYRYLWHEELKVRTKYRTQYLLSAVHNNRNDDTAEETTGQDVNEPNFEYAVGSQDSDEETQVERKENQQTEPNDTENDSEHESEKNERQEETQCTYASSSDCNINSSTSHETRTTHTSTRQRKACASKKSKKNKCLSKSQMKPNDELMASASSKTTTLPTFSSSTSAHFGLIEWFWNINWKLKGPGLLALLVYFRASMAESEVLEYCIMVLFGLQKRQSNNKNNNSSRSFPPDDAALDLPNLGWTRAIISFIVACLLLRCCAVTFYWFSSPGTYNLVKFHFHNEYSLFSSIWNPQTEHVPSRPHSKRHKTDKNDALSIGDQGQPVGMSSFLHSMFSFIYSFWKKHNDTPMNVATEKNSKQRNDMESYNFENFSCVATADDDDVAPLPSVCSSRITFFLKQMKQYPALSAVFFFGGYAIVDGTLRWMNEELYAATFLPVYQRLTGLELPQENVSWTLEQEEEEEEEEEEAGFESPVGILLYDFMVIVISLGLLTKRGFYIH